jgi:hypothetical protein
MTRMALRTAAMPIALLACFSASAQTVKASPCAKDTQGETATWRVYYDSTHHFCFRYPRSYQVKTKPKGTCAELRDEHAEASIYICTRPEAFKLSALVARAPTGIESLPEPVPVGSNTFYYYGPGGGGVSYPDQYFFNLHGKTLALSFDGPYENDKTPSDAAKKMEMKALASFREY